MKKIMIDLDETICSPAYLEEVNRYLGTNYKYEDMTVTGVVGKAEIARGNRSHQLFFVNKRYIKDKTLTAATEQAYKGLIPIGKFGFVVLNLEMSPAKVDVNVHPAKLEVRFEEEQNEILNIKTSVGELTPEFSPLIKEYDLYLVQRLSEDRNFEEGALYAGKNALIYDSVQEEGNIYTVLKNSSKKYVDNFEVIKGELFYFAQNDQEKKWAQEIGIKVSPYIIIDGELMSAGNNLGLMDEATGSIIIPQSVTKIGEGAFSNLEGLKTIVIPGTVKEIGMNAFKNNKTLEKVIIQEGVEKIGDFAFQHCTALKTIKIAQP